MAMRTLAFIDWSDATRQGAHTADYVDGEVEGFLKFLEQTYRQTQTPHTRVANDGGDTRLQLQGAVAEPGSGGLPSEGEFVSEHEVPQYCVSEIMARLTASSAGYWAFHSFVEAELPTLNYLWSQQGYAGIGLFSWYTHQDQRFHALYKNSVYNAQVSERNFLVDNLRYYRLVMVNRPTGVLWAIFSENGQHQNWMTFVSANIIYKYDQPRKYVLGNCSPYNTSVEIKVKHLHISDYAERDYVLEIPAIQVTTTGDVFGAASAHAAISDVAESSFVELTQNEEIIIDLTNAGSDVSLFEIAVVSDCTDTNYLEISVATFDMGVGIFSIASQLGHTWQKRCPGEKLSPLSTYYKKHLFYPEIAYILSVPLDRPIGCRWIKIKNPTASTLKVYKVQTIQGFTETTYMNTPDEDIKINELIVNAECPFGSPGTAITRGYIRNTSDQAQDVYCRVEDSGVEGDDTAFEFSNDGVNWYNKTDGEKMLSLAVAPGDSAGILQVRTNLPATGNIYRTIKAKLRIRTAT